MGNLPIYTDTRNGNKVVTILRKYAGDVDALQREMELIVGRQVVRFHGRLEVNGRHGKVMSHWLNRLGF